MLPERVYSLMNDYRFGLEVKPQDRLWADRMRDWGLIAFRGNRAFLTYKGTKELSNYEEIKKQKGLGKLMSILFSK